MKLCTRSYRNLNTPSFFQNLLGPSGLKEDNKILGEVGSRGKPYTTILSLTDKSAALISVALDGI